MADRVWNFSPGPATLPRSVLERVRDEVVAIPGLGISPLEASHRSQWFDEVIGATEANLRTLLGIGDAHAVAFCPGGATMQFSMVPAMLLRGRPATAAHVVTGSWGERALAESAKEGEARTVWSGRDEGFVRVPPPSEVAVDPGAAFLHVTSNETIEGVQFPRDGLPEPPGEVPLVCDASSDFLSRPLDVERFGVVYAGAQKNAGPAGVTIAIVRRDLLDRTPPGLPTMLDYRTYVEHGSRANTPPVFAIWVVRLVTDWLLEDPGGLAARDAVNRRKAALLYEAIDASDGFYRGHAEPGSRSLMNVTFRLPSVELEDRFVRDAADEGLVELRGHRSVGGIRASLYNAMELAGAEALAAFLHAFADRNG
jgi:phosphoserine aminotransferase